MSKIKLAQIYKLYKIVEKNQNFPQISKKSFPSYPHQNPKKRWKNRKFYPFIHIIHIELSQNCGLFWGKKRTNVLYRYDKNEILSRKNGNDIDI